MVERMAQRASMETYVRNAIVLVVAGIALLSIASTAYLQRNYLIDDAYITFRYARHLALGHGLVWNAGGEPTEGYTNFLLVLIAAPFSGLGLDPLRYVQAVNLLCVLGIGALTVWLGVRHIRMELPAAIIAGCAVISISRYSTFVAMLGLETTLFAFLVFATFGAAAEAFERPTGRNVALSGVLGFLSFLARPEGAVIVAIVLAIGVFVVRDKGVVSRNVVLALVLSLALPAMYLVWKLAYFGSILPNPFFVKVSGDSLFVRDGFWAVHGFYMCEAPMLFALAMLSFIFARISPARLAAMVFLVFWSAFYCTVDPLMNAFNRFLYPLLPILGYLALPAFDRAVSPLLSRGPAVPRLLAVPAVFSLLFLGDVLYPYSAFRDIQTHQDPNRESFELVRVELGTTLATYDDIEGISMVIADAGIIPYFSGVDVVDPVGLNDNYIARERDVAGVLDHIFSLRPTLWYYTTEGEPGDLRPVDYGHGLLGDMNVWFDDPGFERYAYAGTVNRDGYDIQFLVRRDYGRSDELAGFIQSEMANAVYDSIVVSDGAGRRVVFPLVGAADQRP